MSNFKLKATHAPVKDYYAKLEKFGRGKFDNEGTIRQVPHPSRAFQRVGLHDPHPDADLLP